MTEIVGPESVQGRSLLPTIQDSKQKAREYLYFAYKNLQRGVQDERYKLIEYNVDGVRTTQLFDLVEDPSETRDLSKEGSHSEQLSRLRNKLIEARDEFGDDIEIWSDFWKDF